MRRGKKRQTAREMAAEDVREEGRTSTGEPFFCILMKII